MRRASLIVTLLPKTSTILIVSVVIYVFWLIMVKFKDENTLRKGRDRY